MLKHHPMPTGDFAKVDSAVILAAGMSSRLQDVLPDRPKGFVELGDKPIIERSIQQLITHGISKVTIVTGYETAYYHALAEQYGMVQTVHNPLYAESGSMYSLYCLREWITEPYSSLKPPA